MKRSFYAACNSIFSHSQGTNELVLLSSQESYSLSVLMYASSALNFQHKQIRELNACVIIRRIFGYQRSESVKAVLYGVGRLNFKHPLLLHKVLFYLVNSVCKPYLLYGIDGIPPFDSYTRKIERTWHKVFWKMFKMITCTLYNFFISAAYNK